MSKARDAYDVAAAEFIKAKAGNDHATYVKAKAKVHKARAAYRVSQPRIEGTVVQPETLKASAGVAPVG